MKHFFKTLLIASALLFATTGCEPTPEDIFARQFVIRSGEHYSSPRLVEMLQSEKLAFKATFDESAVYDFGDNALQSNKNKLLGFSDCNSLHHENSARFAWQWFNNSLEIYAYCYVDGARVEKFVGVVNLNEENLYELVLTEKAYVFYLNGETTTSIERTNACNTGAYYMLYPYFGGTLPAPHNVKIKLSIERR